MLKLSPDTLFLDMEDGKGLSMREHCPEPLREPETARDRFWEIAPDSPLGSPWDFSPEYYDEGNYHANLYERARFFYDFKYRLLNHEFKLLGFGKGNTEITAAIPRSINSYLRYIDSLKNSNGCPDTMIAHHESYGCSFSAQDCPNKESAGCLHIADPRDTFGRLFLNSLVYQIRGFVDGIRLLGGHPDPTSWDQILEEKAKKIDTDALALDAVARLVHNGKDSLSVYDFIPPTFEGLDDEKLKTLLKVKRDEHRERVLKELVLPFEEKVLQVLA